jgi:hypothetical protein
MMQLSTLMIEKSLCGHLLNSLLRRELSELKQWCLFSDKNTSELQEGDVSKIHDRREVIPALTIEVARQGNEL